MKKFNKAEKFLIAISPDHAVSYLCEQHGLYQSFLPHNNIKCAYCKKEHEPLDISELKQQFKKELSI